jgi:hypothetical protein
MPDEPGPNGTPVTGTFVWERGTGFGFVIRPGETTGYFLSQHTLKESNSGDTKGLSLEELNGLRVSCHLRPSTHPKHARRLEAYQVSVLRDQYATD